MAQSIRLNLHLQPPQHAWLAKQAKRLGISIAELIRRILDQAKEGK